MLARAVPNDHWNECPAREPLQTVLVAFHNIRIRIVGSSFDVGVGDQDHRALVSVERRVTSSGLWVLSPRQRPYRGPR